MAPAFGLAGLRGHCDVVPRRYADGYNDFMENFLDYFERSGRFAEQDENGVDVSLIRENLRLSVHDRLMKASRARRSFLRVLEIGRQNREKRS